MSRAMRHKLAHHDYDTALGILGATVYDDLPELVAAVERMRARRERPGRE